MSLLVSGKNHKLIPLKPNFSNLLLNLLLINCLDNLL